MPTVSAGLVSEGADSAVRAVEAALLAQCVDLGVVFLAQLCLQRDADDASGVSQSPSDIPVRDELADDVLVDGSGCLSGSEPVEGNDELVQVLQYCDDVIEGHADLSGGHVHQPIDSRGDARAQFMTLLVGANPRMSEATGDHRCVKTEIMP